MRSWALSGIVMEGGACFDWEVTSLNRGLWTVGQSPHLLEFR